MTAAQLMIRSTLAVGVPLPEAAHRHREVRPRARMHAAVVDGAGDPGLLGGLVERVGLEHHPPLDHRGAEPLRPPGKDRDSRPAGAGRPIERADERQAVAAAKGMGRAPCVGDSAFT